MRCALLIAALGSSWLVSSQVNQPGAPVAIRSTDSPLLPEDALVFEEGLPEAPAGFDGQTNGYQTQEQFNRDANQFNQIETLEDGLGPVFNARSCAECHFNPVLGGNSQVTEVRVGSFDGAMFIEPLGGSLIHMRAIDPRIQEHVLSTHDVRAIRAAPGLHGLAFVEAVESKLLVQIAAGQPPGMRGELTNAPIFEAGGTATRPGRFGWKSQHASLLSFSAEAYRDEVGITSPLRPTELLSNGRSTAGFSKARTNPNDKNGDDTPRDDLVKPQHDFLRGKIRFRDLRKV